MVYLVDIPVMFKDNHYMPSESSQFIKILISSLNRIKLNVDADTNSNAFSKACSLLVSEALEDIASSASTTMITTNIVPSPFPDFSKIRLGTDSIFSESDSLIFEKISKLITSNVYRENFGFLNVINIK